MHTQTLIHTQTPLFKEQTFSVKCLYIYMYINCICTVCVRVYVCIYLHHMCVCIYCIYIYCIYIYTQNIELGNKYKYFITKVKSFSF